MISSDLVFTSNISMKLEKADGVYFLLILFLELSNISVVENKDLAFYIYVLILPLKLLFVFHFI